MNKLIVKVLGTPIGGISEVDGDGDGFVTGPSGKDNIPAIPKAVEKIVGALDKRAKDITKRIGEIFGTTPNEARKSKYYQEMLANITNMRREENKLDFQLKTIAKEQGFDGLPKVVSAEEMEELENKGWAIAYRGIRPTDAGRYDEPPKRMDAETLAEQFRSGDYFVNSGTYGNGMYFAETEQMAQYYAGAYGSVIKIAIPPNVLMTQEEFREETKKHGNEIDENQNKRLVLPNASAQGDAPRGRGMFEGDDDLGRTLAAQGVRGAQFTAPIEGRMETIYLLFDRSMLAVQESGKKKKGKKK